MTKRILTLTLIAAMAMMLIPSAHASWTMYVSPAAGTTVNLRSTPDVSPNNLITQVPYGTELTVNYISNGWASIDWGVGAYDEGFMMAKYLTYDYVAPSSANMKRKTTNTDTAGRTSRSSQPAIQQSGSNDLALHYENMNEQFRTFSLVARPFIVFCRPERAAGWVNFRYAPDDKAELVRRVRQNEQFTVIGETARWYQVEDPSTGVIGYISRFYVSTNPN